MNIFIEIGLIVFIATAICAVMKFLKQPLIIGYILSGVIVGPFFLNLIQSASYIELFSKIGIAILLFIVGLNLKPDVIREVGKVSLLIGIGQIIITSAVGFIIMKLLGFGVVPSLYGAIALALSSTIIILKLLSDKGDLDKLYGKISIGFLIVQDIFATLVLLGVSVLGTSSFGGNVLSQVILLLLKGIIFFVILYLINKYIFPRLLSFLAGSQELLFLFSIAWGLGLASIFYMLGFSLEIGALVAGVALSASPFSQEISSRMKPLRDFFILLFFVLLGSQIAIFNIGSIVFQGLILSAFVLIINPLIVIVIMNLLGYKSRTSFFTGITTAQISEFSLILLALGLSIGHVNRELVSLITLTGVITIAGSTYFILHADKAYSFLRPFLHLIQFRRNVKDENKETVNENSIVIFGYDRVGYDFVNVAQKMNRSYFVVDFNPGLIKKLSKKNIPFHFGDADDIDFLDEIGVAKAKMIVSTIPDFKTNLNLVYYYRKYNPNGIIIVISHNIKNTKELYEKGASFVIMPHYLGARYASKLIETHSLDAGTFEKEKLKHLEYLERRQKITEEK